MLKVSEVRAGYGQTVILQDMSIHVGTGEIVTIIGSNGAGKSTLLRTISGLVKPTAGRISFDGVDITDMEPADIVGMGLVQVRGKSSSVLLPITEAGAAAMAAAEGKEAAFELTPPNFALAFAPLAQAAAARGLGWAL